ncbi:MAG: hypothetical protein IPH44_28750 [Myxococcales bacterium]|nr:hypothetical protein [Myxococcales bacterium]MBK7191402.1 hypothetical protein [Myxococcales bacterium]
MRTRRFAIVLAVTAACSDGSPAITDGSVDRGGADAVVDVDAGGDAAVTDAAAVDALDRDADVSDVAAVVDAAVDVDADVGSVDAAVEPADAGTTGATGCADGTREGLVDPVAFPAVAACAGSWTGDVGGAGALCAAGWHVCLGSEPAVAAVTYAAATAFAGCFAIDAAQDNFVCRPDCSAQVAAGVDTAANIDLAGVGASCAFQFPGGGGCLADGRIDHSENTGTGCDFAPGVTTGVVCCLTVVAE